MSCYISVSDFEIKAISSNNNYYDPAVEMHTFLEENNFWFACQEKKTNVTSVHKIWLPVNKECVLWL